jgi:hypothetical protein
MKINSVIGVALFARVSCAVLLLAGPAAAQTTPEVKVDDERESFLASGYIGRAIDNFAPASIGGYLDPEAGGTKSRFAGGFDFEFRAAGKPQSSRQLWLFGETLHGVRSADVDCSPANTEDRPPVCGKLAALNQEDALQFVIEHATSLEAYAGARYEFLTLQSGSTAPAKLYMVARLGVITLSGDATVRSLNLEVNRAYEAYHFGGGLLLPAGLFKGSYLEVGYGRTDLFSHDNLTPWRRLKVDGYLSIPMSRDADSRLPHVFVQLYSDFDPTHKTADSIQTFFGLDFDLVGLFGKKPSAQ